MWTLCTWQPQGREPYFFNFPAPEVMSSRFRPMQVSVCFGLWHFLNVQAAVEQGVAAAEGGAAGFTAADCASSLEDMQVKLITYTGCSFSYIYCWCNVNCTPISCSSSIPQILDCELSWLLSRSLSGKFNQLSVSTVGHDTCFAFAQENGALFVSFCRYFSMSSVKQD